MPRFEPFPGLRYDTERVDLGEVTAPPYDVIDAPQRAELADRSPYNAVRIELPVDEDGVDRYQVACRTLRAWRDERILVPDDEPSFTVYRMGYRDAAGRHHQTSGVIGALELVRPGEGDVLPHEQTTPKARSDRLEMLRSCQANLSPVWGLSLTRGLGTLCEQPGPPTARWTGPDGVHHRLYRVTEPGLVGALRDAVAASPVVIADGHHRYSTSLTYRDERRASDGDAGAADLVMAFVVELAEEQLHVQAIHRLLRHPALAADPVEALAPWFDAGDEVPVEPGLAEQLPAAGALALVTPSGGRLLHPRAGAFAPEVELDAERVAAVLAELDGAEVRYQHGDQAILDAVARGEADIGLLLRPATVAQIAATARAHLLMPPKTTFFAPKPCTGAVFRVLEAAPASRS